MFSPNLNYFHIQHHRLIRQYTQIIQNRFNVTLYEKNRNIFNDIFELNLKLFNEF